MNLKKINSLTLIFIISIIFLGNTSFATNSIPECISPIISSINPPSINSGIAATITIYGSNFTNQTYLIFNGTTKAINLNSPNQLAFSLTTNDTSVSGYKTIKLSNGTGCTSNQAIFSVNTSSIISNNLQQPSYNNTGWWQASRYVSVITNVATDITKDSVVLNGSIDPSNYPATVHFEYGTSPDLLEFTNTSNKY